MVPHVESHSTGEPVNPRAQSSATIMRELEIVQRPPGEGRQEFNHILRRKTRRVNLNDPTDQRMAAEVARRLIAKIEALKEVHSFSKGMGIAAPQIGENLAIAVVWPLGADAPIVLINPEITQWSGNTDIHGEGCLSCFDERHLVARDRNIIVDYATLVNFEENTDQPLRFEARRTNFTDAIARLCQHEIDHLNGILCSDKKPPHKAHRSIEQVPQVKWKSGPWQYRHPILSQGELLPTLGSPEVAIPAADRSGRNLPHTPTPQLDSNSRSR